MKILVLNPNTSQFVTDRVCAVAQSFAGPLVEIVGCTGQIGPAIVGTRSECDIAAQEALRLAAEHAQDCDAVLLAISFDSGLAALREVLSIPVLGMSEAGMLAAMTVARRFSLVTFGQRAVPLYEELVEHYRWEPWSSGVISLPPLSPEELRDTTLILPQLIAAIEGAVQERGAEAIVLAGAVFAGIAAELRDKVSVPVIDSIGAAVHQLQMIVSLGLRKPVSGSFAFPPAKDLTGLPPALTEMFRSF